MTDEEKARRYDNIQTTAKIDIEEYEAKKKDASTRYQEGKPIEVSSYNKGKADAFDEMIRTLSAMRC